MKKGLKFSIILIIGTFTCLLLGSSHLPMKNFLAEGSLFGYPIQTSVDSELAKEMLENPDSPLLADFYKKYADAEPVTSTLSEISRTYSTDVSTLFFVQKHYRKKNNHFAQDLYIRSYNAQTDHLDLEKLKQHHIVFIPGLGYIKDTTTGADFSRQRRLFNSLNISNELIETDEYGLSDDNAQLISHRLRELNDQYPKIILVSTSKGGLETAIALGKILEPDEISSVTSWVSVGGILRGSPIADKYLKSPKSWFTKFYLWTKGKKIELVEDVSYKQRSKDYEQLNFPKHINVFHYVGIPMATEVRKEIKRHYDSMKEFGPNDGLTPIADEVTEDGIVISELGLDHFYRDENIDKKTLALALVTVNFPSFEEE